MDIVLRDLKGTECWVYFDDIILYSDTIEEHAQMLGHVLHRFEKANLRLQSAKCVFAKPQVQCLGYIASIEGISASPDKVEAVTNFPVPKNVKEVRSFLGLASFYRRLIPKFAEIAKPLTELTRKDSPFKWETRQETAFTRRKLALTTEPVLAYPDFSSEFILTTDASKVAVPAILSQVQVAIEKPVCYASRQISRAEQNYSASELELLAITSATRHFRRYVYGENIS
jgi:hypothetical protein